LNLGILCSGQGTQHADMFRLTGHAVESEYLFAEARDMLGYDPRARLSSANATTLYENRNAQILCALQTLGAMASLVDDMPGQRCIAGYSVGEVAAWGVAGLITPKDTLHLVDARARAMNAASQGDQGLVFVRGLKRQEVDKLCEEHGAAIAIVNPDDAWVIGGLRTALDNVARQAQHLGATRVVPIAINIASHTPLLASAVKAFEEAITITPVATRPFLGTRLLSGIDGTAVFDTVEGLRKLAVQICTTVQWAACLSACVEAGVDAFLELGPGRALVTMAASAYPCIPARSLDDFRSIDGVRQWLKRSGQG
jgi:[acyl-carrier-protein] S-malonyltransferase